MSATLQTIGKGVFVIGSLISSCGYFPTLLGFGQTGIVGNSFASFFQSFIGNVSAGSIFAKLTSFGMKGVFAKLTNWGTCIGFSGLFTYIKSIL